jgi:hypothetical protein
MAGTLTVTREVRKGDHKGAKLIQKIKVAWTSDASGNADTSIENLHGFLVKMVTDPDGSAAPTDNYDITLVDELGIDALADAGLNRDTANTEQVYPIATGAQTPVLLCGTHTFTVANAGNAKSGVAYLYIVESL